MLSLGVVLWGLMGSSASGADLLERVKNQEIAQVLRLRAGLNDTPAVGLSPTAAVNEMEHYDKSFKGEDKKSTEMKITY